MTKFDKNLILVGGGGFALEIYTYLLEEISKNNDSKLRIGGTVASSIYMMTQGVQILRVHDVNEIMQSIKVYKEIVKN